MAGAAESTKVQPNPIVFMDIQIGGQDVGRIKFELFAQDCPKTVENFRQLCTGEHRIDKVPQGYKTAKFHRVIKDFMVQGGDYVNGDGTGLASIYNGAFDDENFKHSHTGPGILAMANNGPGTNGCQFYITCGKRPQDLDFLDGKYVVFGKVIDGLLVVRKIEAIPCGPNNNPKIPVTISECGEM